MSRNITITIHKLEGVPEGIHGSVLGSGGRYTIILNAEDTPTQQLATFLHEMTHIYNEDAERGGKRPRDRDPDPPATITSP